MTTQNSLADDVRQERYERRVNPTLPTAEQLAKLLQEAEDAFFEDLHVARASATHRQEYLAGYVLQRLGG